MYLRFRPFEICMARRRCRRHLWGVLLTGGPPGVCVPRPQNRRPAGGSLSGEAQLPKSPVDGWRSGVNSGGTCPGAQSAPRIVQTQPQWNDTSPRCSIKCDAVHELLRKGAKHVPFQASPDVNSTASRGAAVTALLNHTSYQLRHHSVLGVTYQSTSQCENAHTRQGNTAGSARAGTTCPASANQQRWLESTHLNGSTCV